MSRDDGDRDGRVSGVGAVVPQGWDAFLTTLADAVAAAPDAATWQLTDEGMLEAITAIDAAIASLEATRLQLLAAVDERGTAHTAGAASTTAFLRTRLRIRPRDAAREVRLGHDLTTRCPALADALRAGTISKDHAHVAARIVRQFPDQLDPDEHADAVATLIAAGSRFDPTDLSHIGTHLLDALDPDGPQPEHDEQQARARREFTWSAQDDGSVRLHGRLDPEGAAALIAAVEPLSAPHPHTDQDGPDPRTAAQRRADGLVDLAHLGLQAENLPVEAGERAHIAVTISLDTLTQALDHARTDGTGGDLPIIDHTGPISPATARRLACDARILPIVLGTDGQPLDVGRSQRLATLPQRRALAARDRGCAFPGCDRPPAWCDAHHIIHWADGGETNLTNLVLLCRCHHRRIHHDGWHVAMGPAGLPEFSPPTSQPAHYRPRPPRPPRITTKADRWWRQQRAHYTSAPA